MVGGRKVLGLLMPNFLAQIHCSYGDLGRFRVVCGESVGRGYVRQAPSSVAGRSRHLLSSSRPALGQALGSSPWAEAIGRCCDGSGDASGDGSGGG